MSARGAAFGLFVSKWGGGATNELLCQYMLKRSEDWHGLVGAVELARGAMVAVQVVAAVGVVADVSAAAPPALRAFRLASGSAGWLTPLAGAYSMAASTACSTCELMADWPP